MFCFYSKPISEPIFIQIIYIQLSQNKSHVLLHKNPKSFCFIFKSSILIRNINLMSVSLFVSKRLSFLLIVTLILFLRVEKFELTFEINYIEANKKMNRIQIWSKLKRKLSKINLQDYFVVLKKSVLFPLQNN